MLCKKCGREIAEGSVFCNWCGKRQERAKETSRRRAKGMGTIYKDKRYANPWIAVAPPTAKNGRGKYIGSFKTVKEAQEALEKFRDGKFPDLYNATLSDVYELWSKHHFEKLRSANGIGGYTAAYKDLAPLHKHKMREIKTTDFQICVDKVAENFSRSKCEKVKQLCSQLCKYAMQNDIMDKNYAEFISLPKEQKSEKVTFTDDELHILWQHSDDKRVQVILFMIYTGFRIGEAATILKENVHIKEGYIIGGIKTDAGRNRIVPLPSGIPEIADFVSSWLDEDNNSELLINATVNSLRQYWFYPALSELGLIDPPEYDKKTRKQVYKNPRITPHSCRHTFASLSANTDMKPEILQKIIGHASFETTADIYIHKDFKSLNEGMAKLRKYNNFND